MSSFFAHKYPGQPHKIITMDNRRMPPPGTREPQIFTLRSDDYPADENVLPTAEEAKKYKMAVEFTNIHHSSMDNDANIRERKYLAEKILDYLKK